MRQITRAALPEGAWLVDGPLELTIFVFPAGRMQGDIDNCAKPILDALEKFVYFDDRQIGRLVVQRFDPSVPCQVLNATDVLIQAIGADRPVVYIRIDAEPNRERML